MILFLHSNEGGVRSQVRLRVTLLMLVHTLAHVNIYLIVTTAAPHNTKCVDQAHAIGFRTIANCCKQLSRNTISYGVKVSKGLEKVKDIKIGSYVETRELWVIFYFFWRAVLTISFVVKLSPCLNQKLKKYLILVKIGKIYRVCYGNWQINSQF